VPYFQGDWVCRRPLAPLNPIQESQFVFLQKNQSIHQLAAFYGSHRSQKTARFPQILLELAATPR
jgi:hypothetical protein